MNGSNFEDVEDRDGTYSGIPEPGQGTSADAPPLRRQVLVERLAVESYRGDEDRRPDLGALHAPEGEGGLASGHVRARDMQSELQGHP